MFNARMIYTKSIGMEDSKICCALLKQMEKSNCNFANCPKLLKAILDLTNA